MALEAALTGRRRVMAPPPVPDPRCIPTTGRPTGSSSSPSSRSSSLCAPPPSPMTAPTERLDLAEDGRACLVDALPDGVAVSVWRQSLKPVRAPVAVSARVRAARAAAAARLVSSIRRRSAPPIAATCLVSDCVDDCEPLRDPGPDDADSRRSGTEVECCQPPVKGCGRGWIGLGCHCGVLGRDSEGTGSATSAGTARTAGTAWATVVSAAVGAAVGVAAASGVDRPDTVLARLLSPCAVGSYA